MIRAAALHACCHASLVGRPVRIDPKVAVGIAGVYLEAKIIMLLDSAMYCRWVKATSNTARTLASAPLPAALCPNLPLPKPCQTLNPKP